MTDQERLETARDEVISAAQLCMGDASRLPWLSKKLEELAVLEKEINNPMKKFMTKCRKIFYGTLIENLKEEEINQWRWSFEAAERYMAEKEKK